LIYIASWLEAGKFSSKHLAQRMCLR
jgi:hypothetical protein